MNIKKLQRLKIVKNYNVTDAVSLLNYIKGTSKITV